MSSPRKKRIAAVVINSVHHDARVLKEAASLAAAGYEVRICGIMAENPEVAPSAALPPGVEVRLVDWRLAYLSSLSKLLPAVLFVALAASVLLSGAVYGLLLVYVFGLSRFLEFTLSLTFFCVLVLYLFTKWGAYRALIESQLVAASDALQGSAQGSTRTRRLRQLLRLATQGISQPKALLEELKIGFDRAVRARAIRDQLVQEVLDFAPDYTHCHDAGTLPVGLACQRALGRCAPAVIYDSHELATEIANADTLGRLSAWYRERQAAPQLAAVITVNPYIAARLKINYPTFPEPLVVCNAARQPDQPLVYDGRLHRAACLDSDRRILLFHGGLAKHRGLLQTLKAAPLLPVDWAVVFMGWGSYNKPLERFAATIDPAGARVRFIAPVPQAELLEWTAGATLGIIPYENVSLNHWFCSPNKIWEYAAASVPFLASPFPFLRDMVVTHNIGWLLDNPLTPAGIARGVAALDAPSLDLTWAQARENCRRFIETDNWSVYEERLVNLYGRLDRHYSASS